MRDTKVDSFMMNAQVALFLNRHDDWTQQRKILVLFGENPNTWICGSGFLMGYLPTYSQRIGELIKDGVPIERQPCADPMHRHRSAVGSYRWLPIPDSRDHEQMIMADDLSPEPEKL